MKKYARTWLIVFSLFFLGCSQPPANTQSPPPRFVSLDLNKDGRITPDEFQKPKKFDLFDQNHDGQITVDEFLSAREQKHNNIDSVDKREKSNLQEADFKADLKSDSRNEHLEHLKVTRDVVYKSVPGVDPKRLSLDIYAPNNLKNQALRPVLVMIHGGGWKGGDKVNSHVLGEKIRFFPEKNYLFVSVNYRLAPEVRYPEFVEDIADALKWVFSRIDHYGGDPRRIFLMGHSAGAHLAALVASDENYLKKRGLSPDQLRAVILLDGAAYDIPKIMQERNSPELYKNAFGTDPAQWQAASPVHYIQKKIGKNQPLPRFLLVHSSLRKGAIEHSESFANLLKKAGARVKTVPIQKSHEAISEDLGKPDDPLTAAVFEFLQEAPEGF